MKKIIVILFLSTLLLSACSSEDDRENPVNPNTDEYLLEIGENYLETLLNKNYESAYNDFPHDEKMKEAVNPEGYAEIFKQVFLQNGDFVNISGKEINTSEEFRIATFGLVFENQSINANVVFNLKGEISGINFVPYSFESSSSTNDNKQDIDSAKNISIEFGVEEYKLKGMLTLPKENKSSYPCVILVHGSGPSDMDETIGPNKPFKDIAEGLSSKGVAVFRYNKRTYTYGQNLSQDNTLTPYEETVEDVIKAYEMLRNRTEVNSEQVYILGHSMGGHLIPKINEYINDPAGYIVMAGNISDIPDLMLYQFKYLAEIDGNIDDEEKTTIENVKKELEKLENLDTLNEDEKILNAPKAYWEYFYNYNIEGLIPEIEVPTLVLQGERDYQVTVEEFEKWKTLAKGLDNFTFISYPKLNHLMMPGEGKPSNQEYLEKNSLSDKVIEDIHDFIVEE